MGCVGSRQQRGVRGPDANAANTPTAAAVVHSSRGEEDANGIAPTATDVERVPVNPATLLSMAMEAAADTKQPVHTLQLRSSHFKEETHPAEGMPDVTYSIRSSRSLQSPDGPADRGIAVVTPTLSNSSGSGMAASSTGSAGLSRNVVLHHRVLHHLQPGRPDAESDSCEEAFFTPPLLSAMQSSVGNNVHYLPMPSSGQAMPLSQRQASRGQIHDTGGAGPGVSVMSPVYGRDRGMAISGGVVRAPVQAMGGRMPVGGWVGGRGRGQRQSPLHVVIPDRRTSATPQSFPVAAVTVTVTEGKANDHANGGDSDDDDDDLSGDEEVEDWDLDTSDESVTVVGSGSIQQNTSGTTKRIAPSQPAEGVQQVVGPLGKNFRPAQFKFELEGVQSVQPSSLTLNSQEASENDDENDDDDDDDDGEAEDGEVHDWLGVEAGGDPFTSTPVKLPAKSPTPSRAPAASPQKNTVGPPVSPTARARGPMMFAPPLVHQVSSLVSHGGHMTPMGNGSPTRLAGPPPLLSGGSGSPTKPPSYRGTIVANGNPLLVPLAVPSAASPSAVHPSAPGEGNKSPIRDTRVVKKKKAELPQRNLPHPAPKFGDWLNSRTMINNYIILESLGAGSYAEVKLCKEKVSGKLFAMKFINRDIMKKDKLGKASKLDDIKREIAIMKKLNHPNVLRLYEVMDDPKMNKLFLVLEYMRQGDLLSHQKKKMSKDAQSGGDGCEKLHDRDLHCVLLQVILGLAYLHEQKIVHGDIKPQNLLVGEKDTVKIADFGISQSLYGSKQKLNDTAGTPAFMSPEMCSGEEYSGQLADIWAVGATVFMLKYGRPPFVAQSAMQMFEKIQHAPLVIPSAIDPALEDLLRGMLTKDPHKRMTLLQIMTHRWVTKEENPSLVLIHDTTLPISVTKDEVESAINAGDKFAIIVNIRVQMKKRLERARQRISERNNANKASLLSLETPHHLASTTVDVSIPPSSLLSEKSTKSSALSPYGVGRARPVKVFADFLSSDGNTEASSCEKDRNPHSTLSTEEIEYRSLMFTRKKPSVSTTTTVTAITPRAPPEKVIANILADAFTATSTTENSITKRYKPSHSSNVNDDCDPDTDILLDDEDELAVAQSAHSLDELLLTTLSMPPLSTFSSRACHQNVGYSISNALNIPAHAGDAKLGVDACWVDTGEGAPCDLSNLSSISSVAASSSSSSSSRTDQIYDNTELGVRFAACSLQGRRNTQEDRYMMLPSIEHHASSRWARSAFVGLYDGHGGEDCANLLQSQLHTWLFKSKDHVFESADQIAERVLALDASLCRHLLTKEDLSGSTATCLLIDHARSSPSEGRWQLVALHVGDCRLIQSVRRGDSVEITTDHRLTVEAERARVLRLGGRVVNNRVNGVMAITRAFGDLEFKGQLGTSTQHSHPFQREDEQTPALLTARPDVHFVEVQALPGVGAFLIIACDGLWDVMTSAEATELLRDRLELHGDLHVAAHELAQEGIRRYSNDNISVIVVQFIVPPMG